MAGETSVFRRELNIWEAVGISVALMAPSMAANIRRAVGSGAPASPSRSDVESRSKSGLSRGVSTSGSH